MEDRPQKPQRETPPVTLSESQSETTTADCPEPQPHASEDAFPHQKFLAELERLISKRRLKLID